MTGFAKYRRSPFATMIGVVLLVAVVFWLLAHPAGSGTQDADFAALAADPGYAALPSRSTRPTRRGTWGWRCTPATMAASCWTL